MHKRLGYLVYRPKKMELQKLKAMGWHCFAATRSLVIKKSGDEERRHLIAVIDFNTQQRGGRDLIGRDDSSSTNEDAKEKST